MSSVTPKTDASEIMKRKVVEQRLRPVITKHLSQVARDCSIDLNGVLGELFLERLVFEIRAETRGQVGAPLYTHTFSVDVKQSLNSW